MPKWSKARDMGRKKYILLYGVLFWGVTTGLLFPVIQHFLFGKTMTMASFVISLTIFPIAGIFFGKTMWDKMEKSAENDVD